MGAFPLAFVQGLPLATLSVRPRPRALKSPGVPPGLQKAKTRVVGNSYLPRNKHLHHSLLSAAPSRGLPAYQQNLRVGTPALVAPGFGSVHPLQPAPCSTPRPTRRGLHPAFPVAPPPPEATSFLQGALFCSGVPQTGAAGGWIPDRDSRWCPPPSPP